LPLREFVPEPRPYSPALLKTFIDVFEVGRIDRLPWPMENPFTPPGRGYEVDEFPHHANKLALICANPVHLSVGRNDVA